MTAETAAAWDGELRSRGAVTRRSRRGRLAVALLGSAAFTAACVLALLGGGVVIGVIGIAFFGVLGIPVLGYRLVTGRPVLQVTASSVAVDGVEVPWPEVVGIGVWQGGRTRASQFVVLQLTRQGAPRRNKAAKGLSRLVAPANDRLTRGPSLNLPSGLGLPAEELAAWLMIVHARATGG